MMYQKGGNAVDAAAAMLAAGCTMWDTLGCGGETQALIYNPKTKKVIGINALGVAPRCDRRVLQEQGLTRRRRSTGRSPRSRRARWAACSRCSPSMASSPVADVLAPAIEMADGYPIEAQLANGIERQKSWIKQWKYSPAIFLPHAGPGARSARGGEIFVQKDLAATFRKLVEAEKRAKAAGKSRKEAIYAAYDRFYKGDIAQEIVRGTREDGGLFTMADLANWKVKIEEPLHTSYKGIEVYKLDVVAAGRRDAPGAEHPGEHGRQGDGVQTRRSTSTRSIRRLNLAFADRDFYYG
jgi:gamma-glutamyltranspeptidase/glutathione hydrolase